MISLLSFVMRDKNGWAIYHTNVKMRVMVVAQIMNGLLLHDTSCDLIDWAEVNLLLHLSDEPSLYGVFVYNYADFRRVYEAVEQMEAICTRQDKHTGEEVQITQRQLQRLIRANNVMRYLDASRREGRELLAAIMR